MYFLERKERKNFNFRAVFFSIALAGLWLYGPWEKSAQNYDWMLFPVARLLEAFLDVSPVPHPEGYLFPAALLTVRCTGIHFSGTLIAINGFYFSPIFYSLHNGKKQHSILLWIWHFILVFSLFFPLVYIWNLFITSSRILVQILLAPQADSFPVLYNSTGAFFYLSGTFFYTILLSHFTKTLEARTAKNQKRCVTKKI